MNEAVFISDLHLHPQRGDIFEKFKAFVDWAQTKTKAVYILGDFLHVWPGDDALDEWSQSICSLLLRLKQAGVAVFFMPGNRDFLLGKRFFEASGLIPLTEPTVIQMGAEPVLLMHGDSFCTRDRGHQMLRRLTRNAYFKPLFLRLPYRFRAQLVRQIRHYSQSNTRKSPGKLEIVSKIMLKTMQAHQALILIHGHIHQAGLTNHLHQGLNYRQYVLSDWDEYPSVLCYNQKKFSFHQLKITGDFNA